MNAIDILIPHYNDPEGLYISLQSVKRQTWRGEFRVVIADDGSNLAIQKTVERIISLFDLNISLVRNEINKGRAFTRNLLLAQIQSPIVAWLDAGDEWHPAKTELQIERLRYLDAVDPLADYFITCNYDWKRPGRRPRKTTQKTSGDQMRGLLVGQSLRAYLWTVIARADTLRSIGEFDTNLPRLQDLDYFIRLILHGGTIEKTFSEEPLAVYHKSDVGRDARQILDCSEYILRKHRFVYERYGSSFVLSRQYNHLLHAARFAQNNGDKQLKRSLMWSAFAMRPFTFVTRLPRKGFRP